MGIQKNHSKWKLGGWVILIALLFVCAPTQAENNSFKYPIKKHVSGTVMSVKPGFGEGRDGEIEVNERIYRVTSKTVMVDLNDTNVSLDYFKVGRKVSMVVDVYQRYNEALFIAMKGK
jgi:hypothetical protein